MLADEPKPGRLLDSRKRSCHALWPLVCEKRTKPEFIITRTSATESWLAAELWARTLWRCHDKVNKL